MRIKALPGAGVATTFYLSNNGGLYDKTRKHPWVELDFEILGLQAGRQTKIWTNMFTGIAVEHNQMVTVPFDVSADYHTYTFDISDTRLAFVVDGMVYREVDITHLADVRAAARSSAFRAFISVWGRSASDPGEGIPAFRNALGLMDANRKPFPMYAGFIRPVPGLSLPAAASSRARCSNRAWTVAFNPERCLMDGDVAVVSCNSRRAADCGTRMSSAFRLGMGAHSVRVKAAPGAGVATTFYLSNNGGLYDKTRKHPWVELDFEILGLQAGRSTKIWTNMFTGIAVEHNQMITVPFDVSADYHTYTFDISDTRVAFVVDGTVYREVDLTNHADVRAAARSTSFRAFVSVWGTSASDPGEGIPAFRNALGLMNANRNPFPLHAGFIRPTPSLGR